MKGKDKDVLGWDFQNGTGTYCGPKGSYSSVPQVGEVKPGLGEGQQNSLGKSIVQSSWGSPGRVGPQPPTLWNCLLKGSE